MIDPVERDLGNYLNQCEADEAYTEALYDFESSIFDSMPDHIACYIIDKLQNDREYQGMLKRAFDQHIEDKNAP